MNSRNPGLMDSGLVVSGMWVSDFNRYRGFGLLELNSDSKVKESGIQATLNGAKEHFISFIFADCIFYSE